MEKEKNIKKSSKRCNCKSLAEFTGRVLTYCNLYITSNTLLCISI